MKRLVFCADGTWNTPEKRDVTNVVKLVRAIRPKDKDGIPQVVFYDWGVGTGDGLDSVKGGAFGRGIDRNIRDGYRFFIHNYVRGDQIWCFGFTA